MSGANNRSTEGNAGEHPASFGRRSDLGTAKAFKEHLSKFARERGIIFKRRKPRVA